jgi:TRAP transporter TAXI family solute receptor
VKKWLALSFFFFFCSNAPAAVPQPQYKIVTASERGTYIVLGRDLATQIAPDAGFELESLPSAGSAENVRRLRFEPGVKLAIVQSDVYQAFIDQAVAGNKEAANLIQPLRVILPLYNEEIYFIVHAESPLNFIHEIKDARINAGPVGSGTALTALTLYQAMFHAAPPNTTTYLTNEEALIKLTAKQVDVVAVVGGQPMKLLADMKPEAKQLVKLLKFDPSHSVSADVLKTYFPATVRKSSYPNLLSEDIPAVAVKAFQPQPGTYGRVPAPLRSSAVPEHAESQGERPPQMEGRGTCLAGTRRGLDVLPTDRARDPHLRGARQPAQSGMLAAGVRVGAVQMTHRHWA